MLDVGNITSWILSEDPYVKLAVLGSLLLGAHIVVLLLLRGTR